MLYYQVKQEYDGERILKEDSRKRLHWGLELVGGELFTYREMKLYQIPTKATITINHSRKKTVKVFGVRTMVE